ncbi:MAG: TIGR03790 family protein [Myxococcota bacterium]
MKALRSDTRPATGAHSIRRSVSGQRDARRGARREARHRALAVAWALGIAVLAGSARGDAEQHPEVLILVNEASPVSVAIGDAYRRARGVPASQVLPLRIPLEDPGLGTAAHETVSRQDYLRRVRDPVMRFLSQDDRARRIQILVTTKGVPLYIRDDGPVSYDEQRGAALDAELAVLGTRYEGSAGRASSPNPYFRASLPFAAWRERFPEAPPRFLVARLTGYATPTDAKTGVPADVLALLQRARGGRTDARWLIDADLGQRGGRGAANAAMFAATMARLRALDLDVIYDSGVAFRGGLERLIGLVSWGSNASRHPGPPFFGDIDGTRYPGAFAPGAIAVNLVSTNGRSFTAGTPYGQSLAADLIRLGAAGVASHVAEPTLNGVARPRLLVDYARGVPAGEAFFRSVPFLSWTNAYIGDPLMTVADPRPPAADGDGDGVADRTDNCRERPNPRQRDSDGDGWGNRCDGDFDGDGVTGLSDAARLQRALRTGRVEARFDLDGNGRVDTGDLDTLLLDLFLPPGPGTGDSRFRARGGEPPRP